MSSPRFEFFRRWLLPAAVIAIAPKCALCLLAYGGLGGALGLGGAELCGGSPAFWPRVLPVIAGALGAGGFLLHRLGPRVTSPASSR